MRGHRCSLVAALTVWAALTGRATADVPEVGNASDALPGVIHVGAPLPPALFGLALDAGYAGTDALTDDDGFHHRGTGTLAVALSPLRWLSLALRADARIDRHPDDGAGAFSEKGSDMRLKLRLGDRVSSLTFMAIEVAGRMPGVDDIVPHPEATGVEARWLTGFALSRRHALVGSMGVAILRDDQALDGGAAPLRAGQRLSYGLGPGEALLIGLGTSLGVADGVELLLEASGELFVGTGADMLGRSPMRGSVGTRFHLGESVQLGASVDVGLGKRGDLTPTTPLAPIEPLVSARASLRIALDRFHAPEWEEPQPPEPPRDEAVVDTPASEPVAAPEPPTAAEAVEAVTAPEPEPPAAPEPPAPPPEAAPPPPVAPPPEGPPEEPPEATEPAAADAQGPAAGFGQIRGHVRSFAGHGLRATATVYPAKRKATTDDEGYFQLDVKPGRYTVRLRSYGFRSQNRTVIVGENGVTVLNVELRKK